MKSWVISAITLFVLVGCANKSSQQNHTKLAEGEAKKNRFWWPNKLNLTPLRQFSKDSSPMGRRFNYTKEFKKLNLKKLKKEDLKSIDYF